MLLKKVARLKSQLKNFSLDVVKSCCGIQYVTIIASEQLFTTTNLFVLYYIAYWPYFLC